MVSEMNTIYALFGGPVLKMTIRSIIIITGLCYVHGVVFCRVSYIEFLKPFALRKQVWRHGNNMLSLLQHPQPELPIADIVEPPQKGLHGITAKLRQKVRQPSLFNVHHNTIQYIYRQKVSQPSLFNVQHNSIHIQAEGESTISV